MQQQSMGQGVQVTQLVYTGLVGTVASAALALCWLLWSGSPCDAEVDLVISSELPMEKALSDGKFFTDEDLRSAVRSAGLGHFTDRDLQQMRSNLRITLSDTMPGTPRRMQIRLRGTPSRPVAGVVDHLAQTALIRLNSQQLLDNQSGVEQRVRKTLETSHRLEADARKAVENFIVDFLRQAAPDRISGSAEPVALMNPPWQELDEKKRRLETRLEALLETHLHTHPKVTRLEVEISRLRERMLALEQQPETAGSLPLGSSVGGPQAAEPPAPHSSVPHFDTDAFWLEYSLLQADVDRVEEAAREEVAVALTGLRAGSHGRTTAWIDSHGAPTIRFANQRRRTYLILLASLTVGLVMAASGTMLRDTTPDSHDEAAGPAGLRQIHAMVFAGMEIIAAAFVIAALVGVANGHTAWITQLARILTSLS